MGKYSHTKAMAFNERDIANARLEPLIKETVELKAQIGKMTEEAEARLRMLQEVSGLLEQARAELKTKDAAIAAAAKLLPVPSLDSPVGVHGACVDDKVTVEVQP